MWRFVLVEIGTFNEVEVNNWHRPLVSAHEVSKVASNVINTVFLVVVFLLVAVGSNTALCCSCSGSID